MFNILIVDDSASVLLVLERIFVQSGFSVTTATNGEEALEMIAQRQFDILICDIIMPKMDGQQLFQHLLKEGPYLPEISFVMTSHTQGAKRQWVEEVPGARLIEKPVGPKKLLRLVKRCLESEGEQEPRRKCS